MVEKHNAEAAAGLHSYRMEVNHLADHVINKSSHTDPLFSIISIISDG